MNYVPKEYNLGQVRGTKWFVVNATAVTAPDGARVGDIILNGSTEEITIGSQWNTAGLAAGGYAKILSVQSQETNDPFKIEAADKHGNIRGAGGLMLAGKNMHMSKYSAEEGLLVVEGVVDKAAYSSNAEKGGFFKRMFK